MTFSTHAMIVTPSRFIVNTFFECVANLLLASPEGLEPPLTVLETAVLPLHQRDIIAIIN